MKSVKYISNYIPFVGVEQFKVIEKWSKPTKKNPFPQTVTTYLAKRLKFGKWTVLIKNGEYTEEGIKWQLNCN